MQFLTLFQNLESKTIEDNFLDPSWVEILPAATIILVIYQLLYSFSSVSMSFQKDAIYIYSSIEQKTLSCETLQ